MATLPAIQTYQQQTAPSDPGVTPFADPRRFDHAGAGANQLGGALAQTSRILYEQDQKRQAVQSSLILATLNNDLRDTHDSVAKGIVDGTIDPAEGVKQFRDQAGKLRQNAFRTLTPDQQNALADNVVTTMGGLERNLSGAIEKRQQSDIAGSIDQFGEQAQRVAMRIGPAAAASKFGSFVDFAGPQAGLPPEAREKLKQAFSERTHYAYFESQGTAAMTQGDAAGIAAVRARVASAEGEPMDPLKRAQLTHQLYGWEQAILARHAGDAENAAKAQLVKEQIAGTEYDKAVDLTMKGQYLSPDYIKTLTEKAAGTDYAPAVVELLGSQKDAAGFASRSAPERAAILERMRSRGADPTQGTNPGMSKMLESMTHIDTSLASQAKENPWQAAQQAGRIKDAPTFDTSDPAAVIPLVQHRMQEIGQVEQWAGRKVSPLQPVEAEKLSKTIRTLPTDQQATMLASLGDVIGDADRVADVAKQLGDKDGTLGLAMAYANSKTTQGRTTAELVLRGDQAIKDKAVKPDGTAESGWRAEIAKQVRGAYSNRAVEDKVVEGAFLIAAANGGDDLDRAVRLASGGVMDFNGSKIPMPYGMTADGQGSGEKKFRAAIAAITPESLLSQVVPAPQATGLVQPGNIDLYSRPVAKNPDGSVSTVRSVGVNVDGKEVLLPTVVGGKVVSTEEAIAEYKRTGQHLGIFNSPAASTAYAEQLHQQQASLYTNGGPVVRAGNAVIPLAQFVKSLPDAQLVHAGQGLYNVKAGTSLVTSADGKRITLKVTP